MTHPKATPSSQWKVNGESDPHGSRYDCERAALAKGSLTDDELANGIFMADRSDLDLISWQQAAKDRIRWLSRAIDRAEADKVVVAEHILAYGYADMDKGDYARVPSGDLEDLLKSVAALAPFKGNKV